MSGDIISHRSALCWVSQKVNKLGKVLFCSDSSSLVSYPPLKGKLLFRFRDLVDVDRLKFDQVVSFKT